MSNELLDLNLNVELRWCDLDTDSTKKGVDFDSSRFEILGSEFGIRFEVPRFALHFCVHRYYPYLS